MTEATAPTDASLAGVLDQALVRSGKTDWRGHDKHDGLNSPVVWALCGWSRPTRLLALQAMMRSPVNLRGLLAVPRVANPKGLALFVQAFVNRWRYDGCTVDLEMAAALAARLERLRSAPGAWSGRASGATNTRGRTWGFSRRAGRQTRLSLASSAKHCSTCMRRPVTSVIGPVLEALPFLSRDLPRLLERDDALCLGYMPVTMHMRVMDVSILIGALYARCEAEVPGLGHAQDSRRLVSYVVGQQTEAGAWWYTDPPDASPVRIDNYHTAGSFSTRSGVTCQASGQPVLQCRPTSRDSASMRTTSSKPMARRAG